jgi:Fur family ferric uptake transcriptional regulator
MTATHTAPTLRFESPETVVNLLRGRGLRVSTTRRIVLGTLFAAERPVTAEEIAAGLDGSRTEVDLASVYRSLEMLEGLGVVRHFHAGHGPGRYVLAGDGDREYLACERCGALAAVDPREVDPMRDVIRSRFGFEVTFTHFPMVGMCQKCRR